MKGQGLEVVLISFRENADLVKRTASERGYKAPVLLDASGEVTGRLYGVWGPPTAYFFACRLPSTTRSQVPLGT